MEWSIPPSHVDEGPRPQVYALPRVVQRPHPALAPVRVSRLLPRPRLTIVRSYVPVKVDYTDLYDIMTFFRGTPDGLGSHEELAAKLGAAGKLWARDHWRKQDMAAYMFRLSLEWSRLLHRDDADPQDYWD
jgi:hypothetical protein